MENAHFELVQGPIQTSKLYEWAKHDLAGAVIAFGGTTRGDSSADGNSTVKSLNFESYEALALKTLQRICKECLEMPGVYKVVIVHRLGDVPIKEESVYIVIASAHRSQGWQAAEFALEEVKRRLEVWKREVFTNNESKWVTCCHRH